MDEQFLRLSPFRIQEENCVKRFQIFLDNGYYPDGIFSKTWDMLAWLENNKEDKTHCHLCGAEQEFCGWCPDPSCQEYLGERKR